MVSAHSLKARLLRIADRVVPEWFPNGRLAGREWVLGNLKGEEGESLKINLDAGVWSDFATGESGGCLVSLYAAKHGLPYHRAAADLERHVSPQTGPAKQRASWPVPPNAPPLPFRVGQAMGNQKIITAIWTYRDPAGLALGHTMRIEPVGENKGRSKDILPVHFFEGQGPSGWLVKGHGHRRDPIYGLDRLTATPNAPVLIVEGEKAADAGCLLFPHHVVISWMGGAKRVGKVDWGLLEGRKVVYWPDADQAGADSVELLAAALPAVESFHAVRPPATVARGWDVADAVPEGLDLAELLAQAEPVGTRELLDRLDALDFAALVGRLAFNTGTLQYYDPVTGLRLDRTQIDSHFRHSMGPNFSNRLLSDPDLRKGFGFTYRPGVADVIVQDPNGQTFINIWRGGGVDPVPGDATLLEHHIRYLCSSEEEFAFICDWLAHLVQHPGRKIMCAIVLVGKQGTGKTGLTQLLTAILGQRNVTVVSTTELKSGFNEYLEARQLVVVEEIMALGRKEIMNELKPLITQPRISINAKHQRRYEIENCANFIFLSNSHEALALEDGDRRYFVVHSEADPREPAYYDALFRWIRESPGVALHWLLARDISGFDPNKPPPMTRGKAAMIEASKPPLDAVLDELIEGGRYPFASDLIDLLTTLQALIGPGGPAVGLTVNLTSLSNALQRRGAVKFGQQKGRVRGVDVRASLWSIRNHELHAAMTPSERIAKFAADRRYS